MQIVATRDRWTADQLAYAELTDVSEAARAMLAALDLALPRLHRHLTSNQQIAQIEAAIAAARAAGITDEAQS